LLAGGRLTGAPVHVRGGVFPPDPPSRRWQPHLIGGSHHCLTNTLRCAAGGTRAYNRPAEQAQIQQGVTAHACPPPPLSSWAPADDAACSLLRRAAPPSIISTMQRGASATPQPAAVRHASVLAPARAGGWAGAPNQAAPRQGLGSLGGGGESTQSGAGMRAGSSRMQGGGGRAGVRLRAAMAAVRAGVGTQGQPTCIGQKERLQSHATTNCATAGDVEPLRLPRVELGTLG